jgi:hypothetical protein
MIARNVRFVLGAVGLVLASTGGFGCSSDRANEPSAASSDPVVADLFADSYACGTKVLSTTQLDLVRAFDAHLASLGDHHSLEDNREGILGNSEPPYLEALLDAYLGTQNDEYLQRFVVHGDRVLGHRDDRAGYTNFRGESKATWSDRHYSTGGQFASFLIEDGALIGALARFAFVVKERPCLAGVRDGRGRTFAEIADAYVRAAEETAAYHRANDWHTGTHGEIAYGYFTTATDATFIAPEVAGMPCPMNYQSAIGRAHAFLYGATKDRSHLEYAQRLAYYVILEMADHYDGPSDSYHWPGWPQMPYAPGAGMTQYSSPDDLAHSVVTAEFADAMHETGAGVFDATTMSRIAHVYARRVYTTSTLPLYLDGTGGSAEGQTFSFGRMVLLTPHDVNLWGLSYELMIQRLHVDQPGSLGGNDSFTGLARLVRFYPQ